MRKFVSPATEVVVSLVSQHADTQGNLQLRNDPRTYIYKTTHISIPEEIDLAVVLNTSDVVNVVLPYYGLMEENVVHAIADSDMHVSGGYDSFMINFAGALAASSAMVSSEAAFLLGRSIIYAERSGF